MSDARIEVGRLGAAHGLRGWLRVQSFTDPPQRLFEWKLWIVGGREVKLLEARPQGNGWIAQLEGVVDRDDGDSARSSTRRCRDCRHQTRARRRAGRIVDEDYGRIRDAGV